MTSTRPEPLSIEAVRSERLLYVCWSDGHRSAYDFEYLRWQCPCAVCQGEGDAPGALRLVRAFEPAQTELADLRIVGRYALAPLWHDGHGDGIYSFEYLRAICPCDDCRYPQSQL